MDALGQGMKAGFDFGSKNIRAVLLDEKGTVWKGGRAHNGDIAGAYEQTLREIEQTFAGRPIETLGITGNIDLPGILVHDPVIASVEANRLLKTGCRNILSIGCESFYLVRLDEDFNYIEHFVNSDCASGTGSFMDQQSERLGFTTETLAEKAFAFGGKTPSIATRCAVFAKSDIIHAQAQGFSREAIAAGLCMGVIRGVLAGTLKGRKLPGNFLFIGGMSKNRKIVAAIKTAIQREVVVPEDTLYFNAIGAASLGELTWSQSDGIVNIIRRPREIRSPLSIDLPHYPDFSVDEYQEVDGVEITRYHTSADGICPVYIGIDVGSTSTKAVVMETGGVILAGLYARTQGDPVQAVTRLLRQMGGLFPDKTIHIRGVATTGSGRALIREVIGADLAINEITAHAKGAAFLDPEVDTIIEIGGQDSKFTLLQNGMVTHAAMNYVCAAGTGSFIEEQAKRLSMTLQEISEVVPGQSAPYTSDRCTVYMERDLNIFLSEGRSREQIMAAVLYSVRDNYLSKVVGKSAPGRKIYFQGATARNKALVAVFENELKQPVHVSKYCHLTGALGCCIALMEKNWKQSGFAGIDFSCETTSEICDRCSNQCDLRIYTVGDSKTAWGMKCGRDYEDRKAGTQATVSKFENLFESVFKTPSLHREGAPVIGIPATLFMMEYSHLFADFFQRLGCNVVIEKSSDKKLAAGMKMINADFCAPMALTHGMTAALLRKKVDYIFLPTLINEQSYVRQLAKEESFAEKMTDSYFCYYSSYAATIIDNLPDHDFRGKLLMPKIKFSNIPEADIAASMADYFHDILKQPRETIATAFIQARRIFQEKKKTWADAGRGILSVEKDRIKILLLGRPYALFDKRINLGIPARLEKMGFELINQTMLLPGPGQDSPDHLANMHWYFGQQILLAIEALRQHPNVYPIFLTCFRCSPDAYLMNYFKDFMSKIDKPYLILQLDEHSSDLGYLTRIEAAVDTFVNDFKTRTLLRKDEMEIKRRDYSPDTLQPGDTILIPLVEERINRLQQAVFEVSGFDARLIPLTLKTLNQGYRHATGGECLPNVAIVGSLIDTIRKEAIDPAKAILHLPSICLSCNFNQYANLVKLACEQTGLGKVRVMNTNGLAAVPGISDRSNALLLSVTILCSILNKLRFRYEPYETEKGATSEMVSRSEEIILGHIRNKKSLQNAAKKIRLLFETLPRPEARKPRIGILGDLYAKFNTVLNDAICEYAQNLGGEILPPSYNELVLHTMHADIVENNTDGKRFDTMVGYEQKFERIFEGLLDDSFEPSLVECRELMEEFGIRNFIVGETAVSLGRLLYYIKHRIVDAVIHVNPVFCCPGVISSSLFRKIQEKYNIPVIDLFYDGTNKPNKMIGPHMFYLGRKAALG